MQFNCDEERDAEKNRSYLSEDGIPRKIELNREDHGGFRENLYATCILIYSQWFREYPQLIH